jgi:hypothetical protein
MKIRYGVIQPHQRIDVNDIIEDMRSESSKLEKDYNVEILNLLFDFKNKDIVVFPSDKLKESMPNDLHLFEKYFSIDEFKKYLINDDVVKFLDEIQNYLSDINKEYIFDRLVPYKIEKKEFNIENLIEEINFNIKNFVIGTSNNICISEVKNRLYNELKEINNISKDYIDSLFNDTYVLFGFDDNKIDILNLFQNKMTNIINEIYLFFNQKMETCTSEAYELSVLRNEYTEDLHQIINFFNNFVSELNENDKEKIDEIKKELDEYFEEKMKKYYSEKIDKEKVVEYLKNKLKEKGIEINISIDDIIVENDKIKLNDEFKHKLQLDSFITFSNKKFVKNLSSKIRLTMDNIQEHILNVMMEYLNANEIDFCFLINNQSFSIDLIGDKNIDNDLLLNNLLIYMDKNLNVCGIVDESYFDKYLMQKIIKEGSDEES